jgi:hypothetical protein
VAQVAEALGFNGFFRSDHYVAVGATEGLPGPTDSWLCGCRLIIWTGQAACWYS